MHPLWEEKRAQDSIKEYQHVGRRRRVQKRDLRNIKEKGKTQGENLVSRTP